MGEQRRGGGDRVARFRAALPARLDELRRAWRAWLEHPGDLHALREYRGLVHRLAGSASANGLAEIGRRAQHVDALLSAWQDEEPSLRLPLADLVATVEPAAQALLGALDDATRDGAAAADAGAPGPLPPSHPIYVLLLEDDAEQAHAWSEALAREGLRVRAIASEEALAAEIALERPDVLLIDYWLGARTAADVGRDLRGRREHADIPRVCLTVDAGVQPRQAAMDAGFAAILRKSIVPHDLAAVLRQAVENTRHA